MLVPNKVKHVAHNTELKSKTDQLDVRLLCRLGLKRAGQPSSKPGVTAVMRKLLVLCRSL